MASRNGPKDSEFTELGVGAAKGGVSYVSSSLLRSLFLFMILIILVRLLTPSNYGFYTIAVSFYAVIEIIGYFGIGTALRKRLPECKGNSQISGVVSGGYLISGSMGVVLAIVAFLGSGYIASSIYQNTSITPLLEIASLTIMADTMYNVGVSTLLGLGKNGNASIANVSYGGLNLVISPILVLAGLGVSGALIGNLIAYAAGALLALFYIVKAIGFRFKMPDLGIVRFLMYFSLPVFVSNLANAGVTNLGILFLGTYVSAAVVGNYGAAFKLGSFISVILAANTFILLPVFSRAFSKANLSKRMSEIFNSSLYYSLLLMLPLLAYTISVSYPLTALLFTYKYSSAALYFAIIAAGLTLGIIGTYAGTLMIGHGSVRRYMAYQLAIAAIEIILMVLLVPNYGAIGLLVAFYLVGPLVSNYIYVRFMLRKFSFKVEVMPLLRILAASLVLCIILYGVTALLHQSRVSVFLNGLLAILIYPPLLGLLGAAGRKELDFAAKVSHRMPIMEPFAKIMLSYCERFVKN